MSYLSPNFKILNPKLCSAWVNFDGFVNPPVIRGSLNVVGITDISTGQYDLVFEENMDNTNYVVTGVVGHSSDTNYTLGVTAFSKTLSGCRITTHFVSAASNTIQDQSQVQIAIFGGKL